eukprot:scaffold15196_cov121-Isochrysis_galbana.AAC.6
MPRIAQRVEDVLRQHLGLEVVPVLLVRVHGQQRLLVAPLACRGVDELGQAHRLPAAGGGDLVQGGEQRTEVLLVALPLGHAGGNHLLEVTLRLAVLQRAGRR